MRHRIIRARLLTRPFYIGLIAVVVLLITGVTTQLVTASSTEANSPRSYLALGDSMVFGLTAQDAFATRNPDNFVGYPDYVGRALRFPMVNASCPGEPTGGFISPTGWDGDCRSFKANLHHVSYAGTQLDFAIAFLDAHPTTRLVTLGLGLNDVFVLQAVCADAESPQTCFARGLPAVLATMASNMHQILDRLRGTRFHGVLMVVNNYSVDYSDPEATAYTQTVNDAVTIVAQHDGALVADAFSAFRTAAATPFAGNNTCKAGLLHPIPSNPSVCDNNPTPSGEQLLARTVLDAYATATGHPT